MYMYNYEYVIMYIFKNSEYIRNKTEINSITRLI